jgi:hypothetical protein
MHNSKKKTKKYAFDLKNVAFANTFLKILKGVAFYTIPHFVFELKLNFIQFYSTWLDTGAEWARIMQILKDNQKTIGLSQTCEDIIDEFSINVFTFLEGTPTEEMVSIDEHIYPCAFNRHDLVWENIIWVISQSLTF